MKLKLYQIGKLNVYRNSDPEELAGLHPADRLMVKLIQLDRLAARVDGMLFKCTFDESWKLLDKVSFLLSVTILSNNIAEHPSAVGCRSRLDELRQFQGIVKCG